MCPISKKPAIKILSATLLAISLDAYSAQVLTGKPDDTMSARVSRSEPTMIRVEGHRIRRVFGAEGDFAVTPDKDAGTAYIKPTTDKQVLSVFVSDESGRTWKLLLAVTDGPSDSIIIKGKPEPGNKEQWRDVVRNQAIKRVLLALESSDETDMESRTTNELVPLWKEAMFVLVKVVEGSLRGEKYMLTNTSDKPMVIDERELYRKGVVAVSVEQPELKPAETTAVYVISEIAQ
ncbi:TraK domain-containing protein [Sulfuricystis multivorans]|uniref:TraK domain-containing protein n=1 Tax=Sulfuricystis multivorans TaxID=2211108 RepID=UPI001559B367|nr:type-F conjugative transfer system secretin TraK [Sulfuricystis multivorans]